MKISDEIDRQLLSDTEEVNNSLSKIAEERYGKCDHGITFDEVAAKQLIDNTPEDPSLDPAVAFVMGSPATSEIRRRWPRLHGTCPKGCGYSGIYYASYAHYIYGDY